ncbi:SDR family NAD(P)-dependent oxidoreductase [Roseinatronobacter bogoriensis]|uniref:SDR family NAD(P)-dependent oxidoreductase n=1 Tax=Roseinatronobacter bogoriensis TaxID=119542 RepID=UPI000A90B520|nr:MULTISPECIES: SDR family NAD(P)-dependent oxidoreductase [Rhodobaca]MBB4208613.1 NAD(P)-dependent dehydrogenase (short-subunit alcohol dehydrogenase family) [Rhodobaca bogoriensis DSM 18756]TDW38119.1 short-subunit dehydrogenase [Rhodobaca barguzinensis]TDY69711.1 short-subunit dehydrogenase [Rhodobaca bogoriensis DSM 18756]
MQENEGQLHILITGAGRGIGRAIAIEALSRGWQVSGTVRQNGDAPQGVTEHLVDMRDRDRLRAIGTKLGPVDVLINNAGVIGPERQATLDMDFDGFADTFLINTLAPLAMAQAVLPKMPDGGRILTISSQMAWMGYAKSDRIAYRASKAAVNKIMQGLATDVRARQIAVALIDPGWVRTDMGGPDAKENATQVAHGILEIASTLDMAQTGQFVRWTGEGREF